jgi:hypothetical protein
VQVFPHDGGAKVADIILVELVTRRFAAGTVYHHIFLDRHPDPLGFGFGPSRFSDPRRIKRPFGVYYVGSTFEVAFLETQVRDKRDHRPGALPIPIEELTQYVHVPITVVQPLNLVDLRGGNPIAMGIPTDAVRARSQNEGRRASLSFYSHPDQPDGIRYSSRLNEHENLAIYDRAVATKISASPRTRLIECAELAPVLDRYQISIV